MSDVKVLTGGQTFDNYEEMRIYCDLYSLADTFSFSGVIPGNVNAAPKINCGQTCKVFIDNKLVMNGYIVNKRLSVGGGTRFDFSGFDSCGYMSRLTVKDMFERESVTAQEVVAQLRAQIPLLNNISIIGLDALAPMKDVLISTGDRVSTVLNMISDKTNTIFYALPNGTVTFGRKRKGGSFHKIAVGKDGVKNAKLSESIEDVVNRIVYNCENDEGAVAAQTVEVTGMPNLNITEYARVQAEPGELLEFAQKQANEIASGYKQLSVETVGFTDDAGKIWEINKPVAFSDLSGSGLGNGVYVVESVEFRDARNEGQTATVKMSLPAIY